MEEPNIVEKLETTAPADVVPEAVSFVGPANNPGRKMMLFAAFFAVLLLMGGIGGGYYWSMQQYDDAEISDGVVEEVEESVEETEEEIAWEVVEVDLHNIGESINTFSMYLPVGAEVGGTQGPNNINVEITYDGARLILQNVGEAYPRNVQGAYEILKTEDAVTLIREETFGVEEVKWELVAEYSQLLSEESCTNSSEAFEVEFPCSLGGNPFLVHTTNVFLYVEKDAVDEEIANTIEIFDLVMQESVTKDEADEVADVGKSDDVYVGWRDYTNTNFGIYLKVPADYAVEEFEGLIRFRSDDVYDAEAGAYEKKTYKLELHADQGFLDDIASFVNNGVVDNIEIDGEVYDIVEYVFGEGVPEDEIYMRVIQQKEHVIELADGKLIRMGMEEQYRKNNNTEEIIYIEQPDAEEVRIGRLIVESIQYIN